MTPFLLPLKRCLQELGGKVQIAFNLLQDDANGRRTSINCKNMP